MTKDEFSKYIEQSFDWAIGAERPGSEHQWQAFVAAIVAQAASERIHG